MRYRIMKTEDGKFVAQVWKWWFPIWDDIFYAGFYGLYEYSDYISEYGKHNNRYSDTEKEAEDTIAAHKERNRKKKFFKV